MTPDEIRTAALQSAVAIVGAMLPNADLNDDVEIAREVLAFATTFVGFIDGRVTVPGNPLLKALS